MDEAVEDPAVHPCNLRKNAKPAISKFVPANMPRALKSLPRVHEKLYFGIAAAWLSLNAAGDP